MYISKWNALCLNNKFKNYLVLGGAMQIAKYLTYFQTSTCALKDTNKIFPEPNSADSELDHGSIHRRHPNYERILTSIHNKTMEDCVKDNRYGFSFNCPFKIKHNPRIDILVVLQYKIKNYLKKQYILMIIISSFSTKTISLYTK